ncbi:hypothetical protein EJ05DRAFT_505075 [Pseudovirgaria hyperparasitica]|uniref:SH3 domain-containing protein n=1 Tax=Pseudovirgaria hyperparasitica TaxID=470096 RepID=A0A6A6VUH4_9PEZI|nr:uncharacterized protein EJ05DRAFT_505075 [Pseudovirgaria hyperparasitica]KAF2753436.1 hypothetical protein EJ05DRAFT_505075 [Pseudovirgaria hyperparasitica]
MGTPIFALGPRGRYFYSKVCDETRPRVAEEEVRYFNLLPADIEEVLDSGTVTQVHWICFGPNHASFFFSYDSSVTGRCEFIFGDLPAFLRETLLPTFPDEEKKHLRLVLGPVHESWVMWNSANPLLLYGKDIPENLSSVLARWYDGICWTRGPPAFIALGTDNAYLAANDGEAVWNIPKSFSLLKDTWVSLWAELGDFSAETILAAYMSPCLKDKFVIISRTKGGTEVGKSFMGISQGIKEAEKLLASYDHQEADPGNSHPGEGLSGHYYYIKRRHMKREPRELDLHVGETIEVLQMSSNLWYLGRTLTGKTGYFPARCLGHSTSNATHAPPAVRAVAFSAWENNLKAILQEGGIKDFPYLPSHASICGLAACYAERRESDGLHVCRHDVEAFLRTSGCYDYAWLKTQRNLFHPDFFGRRCDADERIRAALRRKAEKLFVIFGQLMETCS